VTLLNEIIDGASSDAPASKLLRKLKVVAARTGTGRLAEWVNQELGGYYGTKNIPPYRGPFTPPVLGHFVGHFQSEVSNLQIPTLSFPEELRESAFKVTLLDPIAEIEILSKQESVNFGWDADVVSTYNHLVEKGKIIRIVRGDMILVNAARPIPRQVLAGAVEAVKDRILDVALELEKVAPEAGQQDAPPGTNDRAERVVNHFNLYGTSNIAVSSSDFSQVVNIRTGDEDSLIRRLEEIGVPADQLDELRVALAEDRKESGGQHPSAPGRRVSAWVGRAALAIGTGSAGGLITEAVKAFFIGS
jgi:hypothetical protein